MEPATDLTARLDEDIASADRVVARANRVADLAARVVLDRELEVTDAS